MDFSIENVRYKQESVNRNISTVNSNKTTYKVNDIVETRYSIFKKDK